MAAHKGVIPKSAFKPGQSGNPSGRPKVPKEVKEAAKAYTESAIRVLGEIMQDAEAPHASRVTAADKLLERGWGKATQYIEAKVSPLDSLSYEQQCSLLEALTAFSGDEESVDSGAETTHH